MAVAVGVRYAGRSVPARSGGRRAVRREGSALRGLAGAGVTGRRGLRRHLTGLRRRHGFHPTAASLVHTIYLDAFLLGRWQVLGVNFLANSLARLPTRQAEARRLLDLERKQIELRRALWSSHITVHGNANTLLERFQEQHRLPGLLAQAGTALADAARYVETARARRSGLAVGLLSTMGLPFAVAYAAGALWGSPGRRRCCSARSRRSR